MVASLLPLCVAIQSKHNEKYLSYVKEGDAYKHLRFSGEEKVSRSTKFAIERSSKYKELIHLRCCHNNKYLVKKSIVEQWIIAASDKPEEDNSIWGSTLFEPVIVENNDGYGKIILRLKHVQTQLYVCMMINQEEDGEIGDALSNCLYLGSSVEENLGIDVMRIIDWGTLVILPKRVAFKTSTDGKYLRSSSSNQRGGYPCIRSTAADKADASVLHEVFTNPNGTIGIKNCDADGFWTFKEDGEINLEPLNTSKKALGNGIFQKFAPIKVSSNVISLRCSSFNTFCDVNGGSQQLECKANSVLREAKFVVEEVVASRAVYDIKFHLGDARIYDEVTLELSTNTVSNPTENTLPIQDVFRFQDKRSMTWTNGCSLSLAVKMNVSSEGVPFIAENGSIEIGGPLVGEHQWGETQTETFAMEKTYSASVPPKTQSIFRLVCKRGTCDVPFSYTVREVYVDDSTLTYHADDGVYTATNSYNFRNGTENKPI